MERRFWRYSRNGFTLIEVLFSLSITLVIVMAIVPVYKLVQHSQKVKSYDEDIYIAVKQISQDLIGSEYISLGNEYCYCDENNEEIRLYLNGKRLVKEPGFEIMLTNIESVYFERDEDLIYMTVCRESKEYKFLMTYAIGKDDEANTTTQE